MIGAVDDPLDQQLLSYFMSDLSNVLNIYYDDHNPFTDLIVPVAMHHPGLMHSVLSLASSALVNRHQSPSGALLLRQSHHFGLGILDLRQRIDESKHNKGLIDCTILQTILHCLETTSAGNTTGDYRCHLQATKRLVSDCDTAPNEVRRFAQLFLGYHDFAMLATLGNPIHDASFMLSLENKRQRETGSRPIKPGSHFLAFEGLSAPFACIRQLRDEIRACREAGRSWCSDDHLLRQAFSLEEDLRAWVCQLEPDTAQYHASLLYRQCAWLYLFRTVRPSTPSPDLALGVDEGLKYLGLVFRDEDATNNWSRGTALPFIFLLGCAAYEPGQRVYIRSCLETLQLRCFGDVGHARRVLERIWDMMDQGHGDQDGTWDWEGVMTGMGLDLLIS